MDAVTYPQEEVVDFIETHFVPLRLNMKEAAHQDKYDAFWTPTMVILGLDDHEKQRETGFMDPHELIASLHLGLAKAFLAAGKHDTADLHLRTLLDKFDDSTAVPEAIYYQGVNTYKWKGEGAPLKEAYEQLQSKHPGSTWAKRAAPYRLL